MARLFPTDCGSAMRSPGEQAELRTLEELRTGLPDAFTIFHGVHWADENRRGVALGELDFAIVNQAGAILLVEQKAGELQETEAGLVKHYRERASPVADQVHRALNHIQAKYASTCAGDKPRIDYLVYLPHHRLENVHAAGLAADRIVHAASSDTLGQRIENRLGPGRPDPERAERARAFFRQQLDLAPSVDRALATHERVYTCLAEGLAHVADRLEMQPWRLRVIACAGSGKTQLALRFLETRAADSLYVCFNRPLAERMETLLPGIRVHTFHGLCRSVIEANGESFEAAERAHESAFWREVVERTERILVEQGPQYRTLVVDEGQDFEPDWYELLRLCTTEDADILWLEDPLQNLHQRPGVVLDGFTTWRTQENHRSTGPIARYIERTLGITMDARNDLPGDAVDHISYNEPQEQIDRAAEHVEALVQRGYRPEQIAILTVHARDKSPFATVESVGGHRLRSHAGYSADGHERTTAGKLIFDSIHRYKGQQAPAVILVDVDFLDWRAERARNVLYTAMTRAELHLCIAHTEPSQ